jgi:hypothetical protein
MNRIKAAAQIACLVCPLLVAAQVAPATTVLGLTLGAKIDRPIPSCHARVADEYCDELDSLTPTTQGTVSLMRPDHGTQGIPDWVRKDVRVALGADSKIVLIMASTSGPAHQAEVIADITERFGPPTKSAEREAKNAYGATWRVISATWELPDLHIAHGCSSVTECYVSFYTRAEWDRRAKEFEERKQKTKL